MAERSPRRNCRPSRAFSSWLRAGLFCKSPSAGTSIVLDGIPACSYASSIVTTGSKGSVRLRLYSCVNSAYAFCGTLDPLQKGVEKGIPLG